MKGSASSASTSNSARERNFTPRSAPKRSTSCRSRSCFRPICRAKRRKSAGPQQQPSSPKTTQSRKSFDPEQRRRTHHRRKDRTARLQTGQMLQSDPRRRNLRLHHRRCRHHDPPYGLPQRTASPQKLPLPGTRSPLARRSAGRVPGVDPRGGQRHDGDDQTTSPK